MPEGGGSNIEIAHHLSEKREQKLGVETLEILEAIVLAVVAIATAWSGYQAALWTGHQAELYGQSSKLRVKAEGVATFANQERLYNASTVADWLQAEASGNTKLASLFERRLLPEFRPAFEEWKKTDPIHNPDAPAGPQLMPKFRSAHAEEAIQLDAQASQLFEKGTQARERSDDYVRLTVTLATILLLTSVSQRFKIHSIRLALVAVSVLLLCYPVFRIFTLPRA